jgi:hypothetical protein
MRYVMLLAEERTTWTMQEMTTEHAAQNRAQLG